MTEIPESLLRRANAARERAEREAAEPDPWSRDGVEEQLAGVATGPDPEMEELIQMAMRRINAAAPTVTPTPDGQELLRQLTTPESEPDARDLAVGVMFLAAVGSGVITAGLARGWAAAFGFLTAVLATFTIIAVVQMRRKAKAKLATEISALPRPYLKMIRQLVDDALAPKGN